MNADRIVFRQLFLTLYAGKHESHGDTAEIVKENAIGGYKTDGQREEVLTNQSKVYARTINSAIDKDVK